MGGHLARGSEPAVVRGCSRCFTKPTSDRGSTGRGPRLGTASRSENTLTLIIYFPGGQEHVFYLGPHAPHLTPKEVDLLHSIWLELSNDVAPEEIHHHDVIHIALEELRGELRDSKREEVISRVRKHLQEIKARRSPQS
jgi:hypothetical protein